MSIGDFSLDGGQLAQPNFLEQQHQNVGNIDLEDPGTYLKNVINQYDKHKIKKAVKQAFTDDHTGKTVVDLYEKTIKFLASGKPDSEIKKLHDRIETKLNSILKGDAKSDTYEKFIFDAGQRERFIELRNAAKLLKNNDFVDAPRPLVVLSEMSLEDIGTHLTNLIHQHKAPGRPKKVVKEAIKSDPTGNEIIDLYQMVTTFLVSDRHSTNIGEMLKEIDKQLPDIRLSLEQQERYQKIRANFEAQPVQDLTESYFVTRRLCELPAVSDEVNANGKKIAKLIAKKIESNIKKDMNEKFLNKELGQITQNTFRAYEHNRTGRNLNGIVINASDVYTPRQAYICSALTTNPKIAQDYFTASLDQNASVFVSLHEYKDGGKTHCPDFWHNRVFSQFPDVTGWNIVQEQSMVMEQSKIDENARIVESTLVARRGDETRNLTHLHYEGWVDHHDSSDEELFQSLVNRIKKLNISEKHPIVVNCKAGVGRTGAVVGAHNLQREIDQQLEAGVKLDDIELNIPEIIHNIRNQREGLLKNHKNIAQIYSVTAAYYKALKATEVLPDNPDAENQVLQPDAVIA